jgi:hypothetical protein
MLRYIKPFLSTLMTMGSGLLESSGLAGAVGRSTSTPCFKSGAVTMKMISSTSITSM